MIDEIGKNYYKNFYSLLEGWTITKYVGLQEDSFGGNPFPRFIIKKGNKVSAIEISQDEEGNGGGVIFHDLERKNYE
jgi:hypothetical protein